VVDGVAIHSIFVFYWSFVIKFFFKFTPPPLLNPSPLLWESMLKHKTNFRFRSILLCWWAATTRSWREGRFQCGPDIWQAENTLRNSESSCRQHWWNIGTKPNYIWTPNAWNVYICD
jgi:hypothetical protein